MAVLHVIGLHGECLRTVSGPVSALALQVQAGELGVSVPQPSAEHYWSGNAWVPRGARPSRHHEFDWPTHTWIDPRTLAEHMDAKWDEIKAAREAAINAPLVTPHGTFDSGPSDRTNITDAVLMAQTLAALGQPVAIDFTLADNAVATLNAAQMVEVGLYLGAKVQAAYATARTLRGAIEAATTIAQVQAIHWP